MDMISRLLLLAGLFTLARSVLGQDFVNGGLEGVVTGPSVVPAGWTAVPHSDPICDATFTGGATPDLTDMTGPAAFNGILGNPFDGQTFISGLHTNSHHEGIKQTVNGLTVGATYTIRLHQTVLKQVMNDALDPSGGWAVYAGNVPLGFTDPTYSAEAPGSLDLPWEMREVTFVAPASSVTLKFMPHDDDADVTWPEGIRMGLDGLSLLHGNTVGMTEHMETALLDLPTHFTPGGAGSSFVPVRSRNIRSLEAEFFDRQGVRVFATNDPLINWDGRNTMGAEVSTGTYLYRVVAIPVNGAPILRTGRVLLLR
ncbi:MAG: gliding motility-associated C-terminal domain-containing protein [Flavobacteriales bacterium]|jgi:hypothetical protein|nr:gliding motility-associated C-terminal domain-containing protein [Flavobacteriales bacterium]